MSRAAWALTLILAGCPWIRDLAVSPALDYSPGKPVELRATFRLGTANVQVRGRAHIALRLPPGWDAKGQYRVGRAVFGLQGAPVIATRYRRRTRARWLAFVSFLHTDVPPGTQVSVVMTLIPPRDAPRRPVTVEIAAGVAPSYAGWERLDGPRRKVRLVPAG